MMIESLKLGIEDSSVMELNMSAGSSPLREELRGFLLAMIKNKTIKHLNISGHELGANCGSFISRIITANRTLVTLYADKNFFTLSDLIQIDNALEG